MISDAIQREIQGQADYVIDPRGGVLVHRLTPLAMCMPTGNNQVGRQSLMMAQCSELPIIQPPFLGCNASSTEAH